MRDFTLPSRAPHRQDHRGSHLGIARCRNSDEFVRRLAQLGVVAFGHTRLEEARGCRSQVHRAISLAGTLWWWISAAAPPR